MQPASRRVRVRFAQPLRMRSSSSMRLTCLHGTAWVTRDGQLADVVLTAGQTLQVADGDDVLVVGLPDCVLKMG